MTGGTNHPEAASDETIPTTAERLRDAWQEKGFRSAEAFATAVGVRPGTLRQQLARPNLPRDAAVRYAEFLGVSVDWLLTGRTTVHRVPLSHGGDLSPENRVPGSRSDAPVHARLSSKASTYPMRTIASMVPSAAGADARRRGEVVPAEPVQAVVGERDLPVYGSAQGGKGMTVDPHPLEWVKRPAPLMAVTKGFAVYVVGDSMSPAYEQGDMVFVHPGLPVNRGDDALLVSRPEAGGDWNAIVKRVLGWSDKVWKLQQFTPKKDFDEPRANFPLAYRIVGKYNRR